MLLKLCDSRHNCAEEGEGLDAHPQCAGRTLAATVRIECAHTRASLERLASCPARRRPYRESGCSHRPGIGLGTDQLVALAVMDSGRHRTTL